MPNRFVCRVSLIILAWGLMAFPGTRAIAAEGGWIYEATALLKRFESIRVGPTTLQAQETAYSHLLADISLVLDRETRSRDERDMAVFCAWLARRVCEQLGDAVGTERMEAQYARLLANVPPEEAAIFHLLFERVENPQNVPVHRLCEVETKAELVKARVIDYPIAAAMRKIAAAVETPIDVPLNVIGLADFSSDDWLPSGTVLSELGLHHGLWIRKYDDGHYSVLVRDPMYMASIGEIADKRPALPFNLVSTSEKGIETGYVIFHGYYVKPPYQVSMEIRDNRYVVLLNGAVACRSAAWEAGPPPAVPLPGNQQFSIEQKGALVRYLGEEYGKMRKKHNKEDALHALEDFLKTQSIVSSYEFYPQTQDVGIWFKDDPEVLYVASLFRYVASGNAKPTPAADNLEKEKRNAQAAAEEYRAEIEEGLVANGLVLIPFKSKPTVFRGEKAERALRTICMTMQEIVRQRDSINRALFGDIVQAQTDWAMEVMLNLRFRELEERRQRESVRKLAD